MDHRIIKYYAGELSKEERKALLQEAFSNQELKKEMINCQHLYNPQIEMFARFKMKSSFHKTKRII